MKKNIILLIFISILCVNAYSDEADFIGAWYYFDNYIDNEAYLLIQDYNGVKFVSLVSGVSGVGKKRLSSKIGIGIYDEDSDTLIVYNNKNKETKVYSYDQENNQLINQIILFNGEDGINIYDRVDDKKLDEIKKVYFDLED